jgi:excisionase family DNA binding protein
MRKTITPTGTLADDLQGMCLPEVAERLRCSRRFLENQIKAGWLRVMRLSERCVRVRPTDLSDYLDRRTV